MTNDDLHRLVDDLASAMSLVSPALAPWPVAAYVARVVSTALGVTSMLLREGATPEEAVAAIRRVRRIDTSADDARADAAIAAKPSLEAPAVPLPSAGEDA